MELAARVMKRSRVDLCPGQLWNKVANPIPFVDRGRLDLRNILGVVFDWSDNTYTITTNRGVLKSLYDHEMSESEPCPQRILDVGGISFEKHRWACERQ